MPLAIGKITEKISRKPLSRGGICHGILTGSRICFEMGRAGIMLNNFIPRNEVMEVRREIGGKKNAIIKFGFQIVQRVIFAV